MFDIWTCFEVTSNPLVYWCFHCCVSQNRWFNRSQDQCLGFLFLMYFTHINTSKHIFIPISATQSLIGIPPLDESPPAGSLVGTQTGRLPATWSTCELDRPVPSKAKWFCFAVRRIRVIRLRVMGHGSWVKMPMTCSVLFSCSINRFAKHQSTNIDPKDFWLWKCEHLIPKISDYEKIYTLDPKDFWLWKYEGLIPKISDYEKNIHSWSQRFLILKIWILDPKDRSDGQVIRWQIPHNMSIYTHVYTYWYVSRESSGHLTPGRLWNWITFTYIVQNVYVHTYIHAWMHTYIYMYM